MSFFGGLLFGATFLWWTLRHHPERWRIFDQMALFLPVGLFLGRLGNFWNLELLGRVTDAPWGMYFSGENVLRHPSTLYEALLEGVLLFLFLQIIQGKRREPGTITVWFLAGYGTTRFLGEFFRAPDKQVGFFGVLTLNQILALSLIFFATLFYSTEVRKSAILEETKKLYG
jgi:phosphatidylglycerol:prolipoprotein diacylglycerol transferase